MTMQLEGDCGFCWMALLRRQLMMMMMMDEACGRVRAVVGSVEVIEIVVDPSTMMTMMM